MSRIALWKFNEASSGTSPTSVADSDASPVNLTISYSGAAAWTNVSGYGNALRYPNASTATYSNNPSLGSTKFATAFDGTCKTATTACAVQIQTGINSCNYGTIGVGFQTTGGSDGLLLQCGDKTGDTNKELGLTATLSGVGGDYTILPSLPSIGWHVIHGVVDTPNATANARARTYLDGFLAADLSTNVAALTIPQNATLPAAVVLESGALSFDPSTYVLEGVDQGAAALYNHAFSAREALAQALRWFAAGGSDLDPDTSGASLVSANGPVTYAVNSTASGGLGATTDASTSNTDHTAAPTVTIGASGLNRGVFLAITGQGISSGVSGTPTLNSTNGTKITNTLNSTNDVEWWWWKDSVLPSSAGTYNLSATVDGTNGTLACSVYYLEGVSQSAPTNFGSATGTSTSITASMTSNPAAGSILLGALLDITTTDAPTAGVNQLPLAKVNGTSTGNTHLHVGSAKYVTASGADSMSWTNLTNSSAKIALAIEVKVPSSGTLIDKDAGTDTVATTDSVDSRTILNVIANVRRTLFTRAYYTSNFALTETSISEGGAWRSAGRDGLDWTDIRTSGGLAINTQSNGNSAPPYDDSSACLSRFPADHQVDTIVHIESGNIGSGFHEAEVLVRWDISAHKVRGYEFNHAFDGAYCGWVRWNGVQNDFNGFTPGGTCFGSLVNGCKMRATAVGNVLSAYVDYLDGNGFQLCHQVNIVTGTVDVGGGITPSGSASGVVWTTGNPGIGLWRHGTWTTNTAIAISSVTAVGL